MEGFGPGRPIARFGLLISVALLVGFALAAFDSVPLYAQCVVCGGDAECEDGNGGSVCNTELVGGGGGETCEVTGGCSCTKVKRRFWFDSVECTPDFAAATDASPDIRYYERDGSRMALHRVAGDFFAATVCGDEEERWAILARELPGGELKVTTNPLAIRLRRWMFGGLIETGGADG